MLESTQTATAIIILTVTIIIIMALNSHYKVKMVKTRQIITIIVTMAILVHLARQTRIQIPT